jgi:hypothetical protein
MPAYLVYICQSVSDRKELETYWKEMPRTFMGFDVKLHTAYRPFELLEGEGPVEGRDRSVPVDSNRGVLLFIDQLATPGRH